MAFVAVNESTGQRCSRRRARVDRPGASASAGSRPASPDPSSAHPTMSSMHFVEWGSVKHPEEEPEENLVVASPSSGRSASPSPLGLPALLEPVLHAPRMWGVRAASGRADATKTSTRPAPAGCGELQRPRRPSRRGRARLARSRWRPSRRARPPPTRRRGTTPPRLAVGSSVPSSVIGDHAVVRREVGDLGLPLARMDDRPRGAARASDRRSPNVS